MQKKLKVIITAVGIVLAGATLTANVQAQEGVRLSDDAGIFKEFGEKAGLATIMDDFMVNLLKDPRTKSFFENADEDPN